MGSASVVLRADNYVFLWPTKSEALLLRHGDLLVYDGNDIVVRWPTFPVSA
jgi:D-serine deaminase-like pyridoxal phosphate-dependent protein